MAKENETIGDIVGDIRAQNQGLPEDATALSPLVCDLLNLADRIEAAWGCETQAHKKELETRDAVIQTEVAAREAEREAHKREIDEVVALATRYRTALARINALATYCCQPDTRAQIIEQCETIFAAERNGKTKETEAANGN